MRTYVMGDIHGAHKALLQCLERSEFNKETDRLIQLGDIADGFGEVYECVEELLLIPNLIAIKGNHDDWLRQFIETGYHPQCWNHGGASTARSYLKPLGKENKLRYTGKGYKSALNPSDIPERHRKFFAQQHLYFIDNDSCYVHGGFDRRLEFKGQRPELYYWDRELWYAALADNCERFSTVTAFHEIFIGHTSTMNWKTDRPMKAVNVYNLDTGAGCSGRLTIIDVSSKQCWQSDPVRELYAKSFRTGS